MKRTLQTILAFGVFCLSCGPLAAQNNPSAVDSQALAYLKQAAELQSQGKYAEAIPVAKKLLEIFEQTKGADSTYTAGCLGLLGSLYLRMGNYAAAEPLHKRSLAIREKVLGPDHPDTAGSLNDLGLTYTSMGNHAAAEPLLKRSLAIVEKVFGAEHPATANSLDSLAWLYAAMGKYADAETLYKRSLAIFEKTLGADHPLTATCLSDFAELHSKMGNYATAEPLLKRSLATRQQLLGREHPDTVTTKITLALVYAAMGNYMAAERLLRFRPAAQNDHTLEDLIGAREKVCMGQIGKLLEQGRIAEAIPLAEEVVSINDHMLGEDNRDTAIILGFLGGFYAGKADYAAAEPLYKRSLAIYEKVFGPEHAETAMTLNNLAKLYCDMGNYAAAEPLYKRSLTIREKVLGSEHSATAQSLNNLGNFYRLMGNHAAAEPLLKRSLAISEKVLGPEHPDTVVSLNNMAVLYQDMDNYAAAEPLLTRCLTITEKVLGPDHPTTARSLANLAEFYRVMGNYAEAESLCKRSLAIREKVLGLEHPDTAVSLNNLGLLYATMGNYAAAETLYKRSLAITEEVFGPEHPLTAVCLSNMGNLYEEMGNYVTAEAFCRRSLTVREKVLGPKHPDTGVSLNNLANLHRETGNYATAEPLLTRCLAIHEEVLGPEHSLTATSLANLASLYYNMGNHAAAEPLYKRSLAIREKVLGPYHPNTALSLNNLAGLYRRTGNFGAAESLHLRALVVHEKVCGLNHPNTALSLNNLAGLYEDLGNYAAAEPLFKRSLAIREKVLGPYHPDTALSLNNLAELYRAMGNYADAEPLYKRTITIFEKALGPDHPDTAVSLTNLGCLMAAKRQPAEALIPFVKAWGIKVKQRDMVFAFASQHEQAAFADSRRGEFCGSLSLAAEHLEANPTARRFALSVVLSTKREMLETLSQRQADVLGSSDPEMKSHLAEWQKVGAQLAKATMAIPKPEQLKTHLTWIAELENRKEAAEQSLARASARFAGERHASRVTLSDVARVLPVGSALVEFAKYQSFRFDAKGKEQKLTGWNYIALVLRGGSTSKEPEVALLRLGTADKIEAAVKKWRKLAAPDAEGRRSDKAALDAASQELAALVWNPIVPALAGCRKVYLSPDGELAFVSFGALPGSKPDRFVIDDYDITYVATGRDLVRTGSSQANAPLLVGAPDFGEQQGATTKHAKDTKPEDELLAMRPGISDLRSFTALSFTPLPGTRTEVEAVARLLQEDKETLRRSQTAATAPVVLTGAKADEATVKVAKRPGVLHLATHGFFLPDTNLDEVMTSSDRFILQVGGELANAAAAKLWRHMKLKNPMHRSGIALTGANDTISGRREAGGNDGILTAEEVAGMDLWGTRMVVISACESGLGEAKGGEGVFGLRRAFTMAGAQSLVMTLWAVSDQATRELMQSLYRYLPQERTPQRALLAAQREWLAKKRAAGFYPHPVHWAAFLSSGIGLALEK